jgi:hypothetical protein
MNPDGSFALVVQTDPVTTPVNFVIGIGPFPDGTVSADFGDGYELVTIPDGEPALNVVENNQWCYLSADRLSLYGGDEPG